MREKILVVGASGLIGQSLVSTLNTNNYKVVASTNSTELDLPVKKVKLDLHHPEEVDKIIRLERPDIIINVAGLIGFGKCEANPEEAIRLNSHGVKYLVQSASFYKPLFVQFSTEAVFLGDKKFYSERDYTDPKTIYGKTKLDGERIIDSSSLPSLVIRPSFVYGKYLYKKNENRFIDSVLEALIMGKNFNAAIDIFNSPIYLEDLCGGVTFLLNKRTHGTFHLSGDEHLSKYELALRIAHQFRLDSKKIIPIESRFLPNLSIYPRDTSLSNSKIKQLGYTPYDTAEGLRRYTH